jgi:AraC-like DNA-binding protein
MIQRREYRGIVIGSVWNENKAAFSKLQDFSRVAETASDVVGIKYVIKGCENYTLHRKTYQVKDGCFFLVHANQQLEIQIGTRESATGLCFNIEKTLLNDVYSNYTASDHFLLDQPQLSTPDLHFPETVYRPGDPLSQYLATLKDRLDPFSGELLVEKEQLYYDLAKHLLQAQSVIRKQTLQIKANKKSTREELFKRVHEAKSMMDDSLLPSMEIAELAAAVALSEFHFFRIFKQVYGITPHQYQIRQRLCRARMQIKRGTLITEVAEANGFADIYTFSKAFKRAFGVSPGKFKKS